MSIADLEKEILKIIHYFDIFNYPLAKEEIRQWLFRQKITPEYLENILKNSEFLENKITNQNNVSKKCHSERRRSHPNGWSPVRSFRLRRVFRLEEVKSRFVSSGSFADARDDNKESSLSYNLKNFYFLKEREEIIKIRQERKKIAQRKILKAKKICKWLLFFNPFIKGIAICNDLAYFNAPEESDIDLFVIAQKNKIWMARFFLVLPLKLFGLRPTKKNKKDKICLSFFIAEDNLDLEKIMLEKKEGVPDIYFIYWLAQLFQIYGENLIWQKFYQANNWLKDYLPNFIFNSASVENGSSKIFIIIRKFIRWIYNHLFNCFSEKFYKWIQLKFFPEELKKKANQNSGVIISDKMLKFHNPDKRDMHRQKWIDKMSGII